MNVSDFLDLVEADVLRAAEIDAKAKERVDAANERTEDWRSKAIAADLTRNLREQEIVDLRNQLRHAATRLNVKYGETDKIRRTLDDALTLIWSYELAEKDYIEKLDEQESYIEQLKGRILYGQSATKYYYDGMCRNIAALDSAEEENAYLKRPLWVKIVGWFAR